MAVTITAAALGKAVRIDVNDADLLGEVSRLLAVATLLVERYAPDAPSDIQNQAVVQVVGYVLDAPVTDGVRNVVPASMRLSGANALLLQWRTHRGGTIAEAAADVVETVGGSTANPVVALGIEGNVLSVRFADGSRASLQLPEGEAGGGATSQELAALAGRVAALEAVDPATAAQLAALAARVATLEADTGGGGGGGEGSGGASQAALDALTVRVVALEGVQHVTPAQLATLTATVDALGVRMTAAEAAATALAARVTTIEGQESSSDGDNEVIDIDTMALPVPGAARKGRIYLDPLHQRGYFVGQSRLAATDGTVSGVIGFNQTFPTGGPFYLGEFSSDVSARAHVEEARGDVGKFYWNTHDHLFHEWARITVGSAQNYFFRYLRSDGYADYLAEKSGYAHSGPAGSNTDRDVYWLGRGTIAEALNRLPTEVATNNRAFRAFAVISDTVSGQTGLVHFGRTQFTAPEDSHDVYSWLPIAVAGISAVPPEIVGDLETRVAALEGGEASDFATDMELSALAARVAVLEAAPAPVAEIDWQVISRYHNAGTHPNDFRGYVCDNNTPPRTYSTSGSAFRPSDVIGSSDWPGWKAKYVAAQDAGESQAHRLIVPNDKSRMHVQLHSSQFSATFFISDLPIITVGYNALASTGTGLEILFKPPGATNRVFSFWLAMSSLRELLVAWQAIGVVSSFGSTNQNIADDVPNSLIVRVA